MTRVGCGQLRSMRTCRGVGAGIVCMLALAGCRPPPPPTPAGYFGPTETISEVVRQINANNQRLPTLWASGVFEAWLYDDRQRETFVNGTVTLVHEKPDGLRIVGNKDLAGMVFEIGSNAQQYWLVVKGDLDTMWHGRWGGRGQGTQMPIDPSLVLEVLGISDIPGDFRTEPLPVMRFNNDADAYMFVWHVRLPDRLVATREVWFDRQSKLPKLVLLFDAHGRVVLRAYLSNHGPVVLPGRPAPADAPQVARRLDLFFPDSGSKLRFDLEETYFEFNDAPGDASFRFPTPQRVRVARVIDVDQTG
ncbi:MAG TPA: hypothetical protein PKB10_14375, partial [Tepidisphaeraceae bacterium]|nr:hypothetical protein [Tepidisphaeraceae bacterium]